MIKSEPSVEIVEYYENYKPPFNAIKVTRKMIDNIPQKYLIGLEKIVITNISRLTQRKLRKKVKSRKRKASMMNVRGRYHLRTFASPAWIEIFIDQISGLELGLIQKVPFLREWYFSEVLYHEIGHHIHTIIRPEHSREREDIADDWEEWLWRYYVQQKYWYLIPPARLLKTLLDLKKSH